MKNKSLSNLTRGIVRENPVFVMMLGMCPTLGVTTSLENALGMGVATAFTLLLSNCVISLCKNFIPAMVRIPCYIVLIASIVTVIDMIMAARLPALHARLGIYIPLSTASFSAVRKRLPRKTTFFNLSSTLSAWASVLPWRFRCSARCVKFWAPAVCSATA